MIPQGLVCQSQLTESEKVTPALAKGHIASRSSCWSPNPDKSDCKMGHALLYTVHMLDAFKGILGFSSNFQRDHVILQQVIEELAISSL